MSYTRFFPSSLLRADSSSDFPTPYSLLPTPYSLLPTPYSLLPHTPKGGVPHPIENPYKVLSCV
ncbi:MAG: hypothetical protein F6K55_32250 [Moorea sp. SIO4A3]|nr:hypothetical protein [Moorena sp. SIO4A3]